MRGSSSEMTASALKAHFGRLCWLPAYSHPKMMTVCLDRPSQQCTGMPDYTGKQSPGSTSVVRGKVELQFRRQLLNLMIPRVEVLEPNTKPLYIPDGPVRN